MIQKNSRDNKIRNELYEGLPGTGKSYSMFNGIEDLCQSKILKPEQIRIVVFNRVLATEHKKHATSIPETNISTLHSFVFRVLREEQLLPKKFQTAETDNIEIKTRDNKIKSGDFDLLIKRTLALDDNIFRRYVINTRLLVADEYQDLKFLEKKLLKKIIKISGCKIWIGYGICQTIHYFQNRYSNNKLEDNYKTIKEDLGITEIKINTMIHNYRCKNKETQRFITGYLRKVHLKNAEKYIEEVEEADFTHKYHKPIVRLFSRSVEETKYILAECKQYKNKKIIILGRNKRNIKSIKKILDQSKNDENGNNITADTIHSYKGLEADIVFIVGFNPEFDKDDELEAEEEKNIYLVGFSRTQGRLYVTSSYPIADITKYFDLDTCKYIDSVKKPITVYGNLPTIKQHANFTKNKLHNNTIDSLTLRVQAENAPYPKYVKKSDINQPNYMKKELHNYQGIEVGIRYHNYHGNYYFDFWDINLLKKSGYLDHQILKFGYNFVNEYFSGRIRVEDIEVNRIDLNEYVFHKNEKDMEAYLNMQLKKLRLSKAKSIFDKSGSVNYKYDFIAIFDWDQSALYGNLMCRKQNSATVVVYKQDNKNEKMKLKDNGNNIIHIPNTTKYEIRLTGDVIERKYVYGFKRLDKMIEYARKNSLNEIMRNIEGRFEIKSWGG